MTELHKTFPVHALDSYFYTSMGVYAFAAQCEMLAELGYAGISVSAWSGTPLTDLAALPIVKARYGIDVAAVYLVFHEGRNDAVVRRVVQSVEAAPIIELAIQTTVNGRDGVLRVLDSLIAIAERRGIDIALYPHLTHWTETSSQVVALCEHFRHPRLGIVFNGYHWYAIREGDLDGRLAAAAPFLKQVNMAGSRHSPLGWGGVATMEPIGSGELDNFAFLGALKRIGYDRRIGFLGWDIGGDVYLKLRRSLAAFRAMEGRLAAHPDWRLNARPPVGVREPFAALHWSG
jgi:sugar phosphate isomerase/epimerase